MKWSLEFATILQRKRNDFKIQCKTGKKKKRNNQLTIPQKRLKSPLPPPPQPPLLMLQRLDDLQIRRLDRHDRLPAQHQVGKSRGAHRPEALLAVLEHPMFAESRQALAELVQAEDVVPLRVEGGGEGALGGCERAAGAVEVQFLGEGVEDVDCC